MVTPDPFYKSLPQPFPFWMLTSNQQWEKVLHLGERYVYATRDIIMHSNTPSRIFFYLQSGKVRCEQLGLNGNMKLCYTVQSGSIFGEAISISSIPSFARFLTVEKSVVYSFPVDILYTTIAQEHPDLLMNLMELLAYKVRMYSLHLYSTTLNDVGSQVCRILYQMLIEDGNDDVECVPRFSQQDIAAVLGLHRNTIVRAVKKLKEEGILEYYTRKRLRAGSLERLLQRSMNPKIQGNPI